MQAAIMTACITAQITQPQLAKTPAIAVATLAKPSSSSLDFSVAATELLCVVITELLRPKLDLTQSIAVGFFAFGSVPGFPFWQFGGFSAVLVEDSAPASWSFCLPFALMLPGPKGSWN